MKADISESSKSTHAIEMVYFRNLKDHKHHPPEALKQKIDKGEPGVKTGVEQI
jgi:hypothetical protein